jgi:hypothetical protein
MTQSVRYLAAVATATVWMLAPGCGADDGAKDPETAGAGSWDALPTGPLTPREGALALWSGREVLLIGGSDAPPCPPTAECAPPDLPPLADGAAFDPRNRSWRAIADSPVPFEWAEGVVVGRTAYLWIPGSSRPAASRAFLAYRIDEDRWERLPPPSTEPDRDYHIAAAGARVVAYLGSDEFGKAPDLLFDPQTRSWSELPPDPLSPGFDRIMAWSGTELVLLDHELVPQPGAGSTPSVVRAAVLDLETGSWRRLPDSEIIGSGPWVTFDGRLFNPTLGGADGGQNEWGRTYPWGGVLDPARGEWSALPDPPDEEDHSLVGVLTPSGGHYFSYEGWVLDARNDSWTRVPAIEAGADVDRGSVAAAGDDLFVFGGVRWDGLDGTLLNDTWSWSPPTGG